MSGPELFKARMKWMCEQNRALNPRTIQTDSSTHSDDTDTPGSQTRPDSNAKAPCYVPVLNENTLMVGMSATASPEECWECFTAGMHFFVAKPVDSSIMRTLVEAAHIIAQGRYRTTQALPLVRTSDVVPPSADVAALTYSTDDYLAQADRFLRASKQCEECIHDDCGAHKCGVIISAPLTHPPETPTSHSHIGKVNTKSSKENGDTRPASTANIHALGLSGEGGGEGDCNNIEHYVEVKPSASLARRIMRSFSAHLRLNT